MPLQNYNNPVTVTLQTYYNSIVKITLKNYKITEAVWDVGVEEDGKDQLKGHENKWRGTTIGTRKNKSNAFDLEKEEKLHWSYTQAKTC